MFSVRQSYERVLDLSRDIFRLRRLQHTVPISLLPETASTGYTVFSGVPRDRYRNVSVAAADVATAAIAATQQEVENPRVLQTFSKEHR